MKNHLELNLDCTENAVAILNPFLKNFLNCLKSLLCSGALLCWRTTPFCSKPDRLLRIAGHNQSDNNAQ